MKSLVKGLPRSSQQLNRLFTADCEILRVANSYICCSTDSLAEEIDIGLYRDPFTWGWMTVASNVSDLAATGAKPLGLLIANQWCYGTSKKIKDRYFSGVRSALKKMQVPLLGGDSGSAHLHSHAGTIIGTSRRKPLTRLGVKPGDYAIVLGKRRGGLGPSLAFQLLFKKTSSLKLENEFRPSPNLKLATKLFLYAKASIDSSDGIATSLDTIGQLNGVGFSLDWNHRWASPLALKFCQSAGLHPVMLMMGDHGDFQTLFFVSGANLKKISKLTNDFCVLGRATKGRDINLNFEGLELRLPTEKVVQCARETKAIYRAALEMNNFLLKETKVKELNLR